MTTRLTNSQNQAQEVVVALFDRNVPGGIGSVEPNWSKIFHQYQTVRGYLGNVLVPGGTCTGRLENSAPVQKSSEARVSGEAPSVSLPAGLEVYTPRQMEATIEFRTANGKVVE